MILEVRQFIKNQYVRDFSLTLLFGTLSIILGTVHFEIPGFEGSHSDLREVPLLISVFHIRNFFFLPLISLMTLIGVPADASYLATFLMHTGALVAAWIAYQVLKKLVIRSFISGVLWLCITLLYYVLLLVPIMIVIYQMEGLNEDKSFITSYTSILSSIRFEIITSALVTSLYLIQLRIRKSLEASNENLEEIVKTRTKELSQANSELVSVNEELNSTNEKIKILNETLEELVRKRSERINRQFHQLIKYANMNSHEVRGPLARVMGLTSLLQNVNSEAEKHQVLTMLLASSKELDEVINRMNRLLEEEIR
jgi:signal transduction histidine kinase